jgi:hypothetical protein
VAKAFSTDRRLSDRMKQTMKPTMMTTVTTTPAAIAMIPHTGNLMGACSVAVGFWVC